MKNDLYSAFEKSQKHNEISKAAREYLGREPQRGDLINVWVHSQIMNKSFLKTFKVN